MSSLKRANVTFLHSASSRICNGFFVTKATGYENDWHWTGERQIGPENDQFCSWFFTNRFLFPPILDENYFPMLRAFFESKISGKCDPTQPLAIPPDDNYLNFQAASPEVEQTQAKLFEHFGRHAFRPLQNEMHLELTMRLLTQFCNGYAEVFCYRAGRCDFFAALAETTRIVEPNLMMKSLERRIQPRSFQ